MSPEAKEMLDYIVAIAGPSALGGIAIAMFGWLKARAEKPGHIAPEKPTVGAQGMAQIAGMVLGQSDVKDLNEGLRLVSASYDRCTLARETETLSRKKEAEENREHEKRLLAERRDYESRIAEDRHREHQQLIEVIQNLIRSIRDMRCAN
jgi:hypothetical protein